MRFYLIDVYLIQHFNGAHHENRRGSIGSVGCPDERGGIHSGTGDQDGSFGGVFSGGELSMNVYTNDDGTKWTCVPLKNDAEDWSKAYQVTDRSLIPAHAYFCGE